MLEKKYNCRFKKSCRAASLHLAVELVLLVFAALWVLAVWYPSPYREMLGIWKIFPVFAVAGFLIWPVIVFMAFRKSKEKKELAIDLGLVFFLQLCFLVYGFYVLMGARPVYVVFEVDRFRVVLASEITPADLSRANSRYRELPLLGPKMIGIRDPGSPEEFLESVGMSLAGKEPSVRPWWWKDYGEAAGELEKKVKLIAELRKEVPEKGAIIASAISELKMTEDEIRWLPITSSKNGDWVALIKKSNWEIVDILPIDGFIKP